VPFLVCTARMRLIHTTGIATTQKYICVNAVSTTNLNTFPNGLISVVYIAIRKARTLSNIIIRLVHDSLSGFTVVR
jgi:hypothetical protein